MFFVEKEPSGALYYVAAFTVLADGSVSQGFKTIVLRCSMQRGFALKISDVPRRF